MTELYFLDSEFHRCAGPIEEVRSFVFSERYLTFGSFSMELPVSYADAVLGAVYVEVIGKRSLGRIEKIVFDGTHGTLSVSGRLAESLLEDRIILRGTTADGTASAVIRAVLRANGVGSGERQIPNLTLGTITGLDGDETVYHIGYTDCGQTLDTWLRAILAPSQASYRVILNADGDGLVLEIYRGLDRTQAQSVNSFAIFSTSFASIGALSMTFDEGSYKNYAYIAGEGDGEQRVTAEIDLRRDEDEALRELYVDARDLRSDDGESVMSADAYLKALLARGQKRLSEHERIERLEGVTASMTAQGDVFGCMRAGVDFSLGDLCDVVCEQFPAVFSERVTELTTVTEGAGTISYARFGSSYPDLRQRLKQLDEYR